ncbi:MAG: Trm112 family protein [bacterium]|nr:Trm112 family protein [bacterium]
MSISKELLDILACPVSKKPLELSGDGNFLICRESKLVYRIEDDIPIMLVDEAIPLDEWEKSRSEG